MGAALARFGTLLLKLIKGITDTVGVGNIVGWTISVGIAAAYIAIWLGVLTYAFSVSVSWFIGAAPDIFGGSNFPSGAMWLLNQTFPLSLMFGSAVSLLIFRYTVAYMVSVAITASRKLK